MGRTGPAVHAFRPQGLAHLNKPLGHSDSVIPPFSPASGQPSCPLGWVPARVSLDWAPLSFEVHSHPWACLPSAWLAVKLSLSAWAARSFPVGPFPYSGGVIRSKRSPGNSCPNMPQTHGGPNQHSLTLTPPGFQVTMTMPQLTSSGGRLLARALATIVAGLLPGPKGKPSFFPSLMVGAHQQFGPGGDD